MRRNMRLHRIRPVHVTAFFVPVSVVVALACSSTSSGGPPLQDHTSTGGTFAGSTGGSGSGLDAGPETSIADAIPPDDATCGKPSTTAPAHFCDLPPSCDPVPSVPDGFCARKLNDGANLAVREPRAIRIAPNGDVFLAAPSAGTPGGASGGPGAILVLPDDDHDGRADAVQVFAGGNGSGACSSDGETADPWNLACVHGIAFADGYLYFARSSDVRRIAYTKGDRKAQGASELVGQFPPGGGSIRWTHTLDKASDGTLYVSRGRFDASSCDSSMGDGVVFSFSTTGGPPSVVADGFRNPMYVRCDATHGLCFANELSGDGWDGVGGREKLVTLTPGDHYGYPCCVTKSDPAPGGTPELCANVGAELVPITLHDTPFGLDFAPSSWPPPYAGSIFIALHGAVGSWIGTRVSFVTTDPSSGLPASTVTDFAKGWGHDPQGIVGRATDVAFAPDGRLFVIDDTGGGVYWIAPTSLPLSG